jgi:hypothetical protein
MASDTANRQLDHRMVVLVLSSMLVLQHDEGARTVLFFGCIVAMLYHLPSDLTIDLVDY